MPLSDAACSFYPSERDNAMILTESSEAARYGEQNSPTSRPVMEQALTTWPSWYPSDCPPETASQATGEFFRLVANDVVDEHDFRTNIELHQAGLMRKTWSDADDWKAAACSVHASREDADYTRSSFGALRKKRIAKGRVDGDGRILATPSKTTESHHSWWRPISDRAWTTFSVTP
jgi:hypothetical protein